MKQKVLNITSILLLVVVFVTTSGFNLYSHLCTASGSKDISVVKIESCCDHNTETSTAVSAGESCCETSNQLIKLEVKTTAHKAQNLLPDLKIVSIPLLQFIVPAIADVELTQFAQDIPPPKLGRDILLAKQVFRI